MSYLIGAEVCKRFHRETFNLYRSLTVKRIYRFKASDAQVEELEVRGIIPHRTRSATFVDYDATLAFLEADPRFRARFLEPYYDKERALDSNIQESHSSTNVSDDCNDSMPEPWVILARMIYAK